MSEQAIEDKYATHETKAAGLDNSEGSAGLPSMVDDLKPHDGDVDSAFCLLCEEELSGVRYQCQGCSDCFCEECSNVPSF